VSLRSDGGGTVFENQGPVVSGWWSVCTGNVARCARGTRVRYAPSDKSLGYPMPSPSGTPRAGWEADRSAWGS
jgi:hypothetical protein